jgi:gamma-glutamylputrescine oxidase
MNHQISYWEKAFYDQADIVVIGAGLVGLQTAINIKEIMPKRNVWILDKHSPGNGAYLRNAGFACFGNMGEIVDDAKTMGMDEAINLYRMRFEGFIKLKETIGEWQMGYEQSGGFEIFRQDQGAEYENLLKHVDQINDGLSDIGPKACFIPKPISKLRINSYENGFHTEYEGTIQTHLLVHALRRKAQSLGVEIYEGWGVKKIELTTLDRHKIYGDDGHIIESRCLVICNNAWATNLLPDLDVKPGRGQIIVSSPIANLPWRGLIHCDKGYIYARSLGTRILIGGGRNLDLIGEETHKQETTAQIEKYLEQFITEILVPNEPFTIDYKWAGIMGMGASRMPIIKEIHGGLFCGVRMGGMGVAISANVAKKLSNLVSNKYN